MRIIVDPDSLTKKAILNPLSLSYIYERTTGWIVLYSGIPGLLFRDLIGIACGNRLIAIGFDLAAQSHACSLKMGVAGISRLMCNANVIEVFQPEL